MQNVHSTCAQKKAVHISAALADHCRSDTTSLVIKVEIWRLSFQEQHLQGKRSTDACGMQRLKCVRRNRRVVGVQRGRRSADDAEECLGSINLALLAGVWGAVLATALMSLSALLL